MPKKNIKTTEDTVKVNGHKGDGFNEQRSVVYKVEDNGKIEAMRHTLLPPDLLARIEMSDWLSLEVVPNAMIMVQSEYCKDPTIDPVFTFMKYIAAFRRGVDGALVEKTILLQRSDPSRVMGIGGFGGGDMSGTGMGF